MMRYLGAFPLGHGRGLELELELNKMKYRCPVEVWGVVRNVSC